MPLPSLRKTFISSPDLLTHIQNHNHTNRHGFLFPTPGDPFAFEAALDALRVNMTGDFQQRANSMLSDIVHVNGLDYGDDEDEFEEESDGEDEVGLSEFFQEV